jgi:hypothetical protein
MNKSDNINFRGKYKQYDPDGKPRLYKIGDSVQYNGKTYVAISPNSFKIPTTPTGESVWKEISENQSFYISESSPDDNPLNAGDRWYKPSDGIVYTLIQEENDQIWVEF